MPQPCATRRTYLAVALVLTLAAGCATTSGRSGCDDGENDPLEPLNRRVFALDMTLDRVLVKPAAKAYRAVLPEFVRDRVRAVVDDIKEPLVFINDVLQGRATPASITAKRFLINSTIGLFGMFDRATALGYPRQSGDFGQTLFSWGIDSGPYLVLPLLGPSNLRDTLGLGVDFYASPVGRVGSDNFRHDLSVGTFVADGLDQRSRNIEAFDELDASSLDLYATLRSITRQQRRAVLQQAREGHGADGMEPDPLLDPEASGASAPASAPAGAEVRCTSATAALVPHVASSLSVR
jgi:phospholipid-binding lipoprotein MlaA